MKPADTRISNVNTGNSCKISRAPHSVAGMRREKRREYDMLVPSELISENRQIDRKNIVFGTVLAEGGE